MKTAIVLFNLGGPDGPDAVKPFRVNLFSDKAIIRAPIFIRFWLARLIAAIGADRGAGGGAGAGAGRRGKMLHCDALLVSLRA
jgi:ferrochelatase